MKTLRLRADTEAALIAALPMLRGVDMDGATFWLTAGPVCDCTPIGPMTITQAVIDPETMEVVTPPVIDSRYHMNILGPRRGAEIAEWEAIVAAAAPFTLPDIANPLWGHQE